MNIENASQSPDDSSQLRTNQRLSHDSSLTPPTPVTQFQMTWQAISSAEGIRMTSHRQQVVNEWTTWPADCDEANGNGIPTPAYACITTPVPLLAWDSPFRHGGEIWCVLVLWGLYLSFVRLRLLLAADIECNPGPVDVTTKPHIGTPEENTTPPSTAPPPHMESSQAPPSAGMDSSIDSQAEPPPHSTVESQRVTGVAEGPSLSLSTSASASTTTAEEDDVTLQGDSSAVTSTQLHGEHGGTNCLPLLSQSTVGGTQQQLGQQQQPPHALSGLQHQQPIFPQQTAEIPGQQQQGQRREPDGVSQDEEGGNRTFTTTFTATLSGSSSPLLCSPTVEDAASVAAGDTSVGDSSVASGMTVIPNVVNSTVEGESNTNPKDREAAGVTSEATSESEVVYLQPLGSVGPETFNELVVGKLASDSAADKKQPGTEIGNGK